MMCTAVGQYFPGVSTSCKQYITLEVSCRMLWQDIPQARDEYDSTSHVLVLSQHLTHGSVPY